MSMPKTYKCPACGWVHVAIPLEDAEAGVRSGNAYAAAQGEPQKESIDRYLKCFRCGADSSTFVPAKDRDVPAGSTIQSVVVPCVEFPAPVLGKATSRAALLLGLGTSDVMQILGVTERVAFDVRQGYQDLDPDSKEGRQAAMLVRAQIALDVMVGKNDGLARAWLGGQNRELGGVPIELMRQGNLDKVVAYLEGRMAT